MHGRSLSRSDRLGESGLSFFEWKHGFAHGTFLTNKAQGSAASEHSEWIDGPEARMRLGF